ncbi:ribosomal protein L6e-domain-containing protein [Pilobolus umbonatus]|nr:ribosomal protein L6e-domain-containing protein [Pilobolus umbonatus]
MAHAPRNSVLAPGVNLYSRSSSYSKKVLYKRKHTKTAAAAKTTPAFKVVDVKGGKNGGKRTIPAQKASRFYPAEDVPQPKVSRKAQSITPLRKTITPGTVLILLAGRYRGKRVVFLKQLESGLLLVTGPFKVNGVPIRRVNQAYVIATSTKLDISAVKTDSINDAYFKKAAKTEKAFLEGADKKKAPLAESKVSTQKTIDNAIIAAAKKDAILVSYLKSSFSLSKGQFPHNMQF